VGRTAEVPNLIGVAEPIIVAVDNGGTNTRIKVQHGDKDLGSVTYATPEDYERAIISLSLATKLIAGGRPVDAIGFAIAGQVDGDTIVDAGQLKAFGWCHMPISDDVAVQMGMKSNNVSLMGDCSSAAKSQLVENRKNGDSAIGYIETISTGWGGAGFKVTDNLLIPDEPGHNYLRAGATCGCGREGCAEAHISGSGIERKFGIPGQNLDSEQWKIVISDMVAAHAEMLKRFDADGFTPAGLHFFGSVALKGQGILQRQARQNDELKNHGVLQDLRDGLSLIKDELPFLPPILVATNGDDSGIIGAEYAARELLAA